MVQCTTLESIGDLIPSMLVKCSNSSSTPLLRQSERPGFGPHRSQVVEPIQKVTILSSWSTIILQYLDRDSLNLSERLMNSESWGASKLMEMAPSQYCMVTDLSLGVSIREMKSSKYLHSPEYEKLRRAGRTVRVRGRKIASGKKAYHWIRYQGFQALAMWPHATPSPQVKCNQSVICAECWDWRGY